MTDSVLGAIASSPSSSAEPPAEKRKAGDDANYQAIGDGFYKCKTCGGDIMGARVAHPLWVKGRPGVGYGECRYSDEPYCPTCEVRPSFHGAPEYYE